MKRIGWCVATTLVVLLGGAGPALAQEAGAPVEVAFDEGLAAMRGRILAFVEALVDYTKDVRLSEADLEAILAHYGALDGIHGERDDGELVERAFEDGRYDFDVIVDDPAYVAWCRERGLEPEPFFRALLRLEALRMREEGLAGLDEARAELPVQKAALEEMRGQLGDEAYVEGLAALEAAAAMVEETRVLMSSLPVPSGDEGELLEEHRARIDGILGEDALE